MNLVIWVFLLRVEPMDPVFELRGTASSGWRPMGFTRFRADHWSFDRWPGDTKP